MIPKALRLLAHRTPTHWRCYGQTSAGGRSTDRSDPRDRSFLVRTEGGRKILEGASRSGYVTLRRVGAEKVFRAQTNLLERRRTLSLGLLPCALLACRSRRMRGSLSSAAGVGSDRRSRRNSARNTRRIVQRGWFRRRRRWSDAAFLKFETGAVQRETLLSTSHPRPKSRDGA